VVAIMTDDFLSYVFARLPTQQKKVSAFFAREPRARQELGEFLTMYRPIWEKPEVGGLVGLADAYGRLISEVMFCRIQFMRTGTYALDSQAEAMKQIYDNASQMIPYMLGLAVSQYLWQSHYKLLHFYKHCVGLQNPNGRFLEVGSGHGIFVNYLASQITPEATLEVVDISPVSIAMSKELLAATNPAAAKRIRFTESDVIDYRAEETYDFIGMGEVLEHVEDPVAILQSLRRHAGDSGSVYVTTCVNAPAIDHVYLFHNVEEIRTVIGQAGFEVSEEIVVPSEEGKSIEFHQNNKLDILYGALLKKA
jgi:2-polyprenyl-3-methyl-5-hydroxy-6-metoxy-1,4-benzoquinol methylase